VEEQKQISEVLGSIDVTIQRLLTGLGKLCSLKSGLMQDLLTGEKRVTSILEPESKREKTYAER
jgi:hypothetical protein